MRVIKGASWRREREFIRSTNRISFQSAHSVPRPDRVKKIFPEEKMKKEIEQNLVFTKMSADPRPTPSSQSLADFRLGFSPAYVLVGVYRLSTDASIRVPVWKKCKHGFVRGLLVGLTWVSPQALTPNRASRLHPLPGVLHVWNPKKLHSILSIQVRSATRPIMTFTPNPTSDLHA
jgi:hypothetical protein